MGAFDPRDAPPSADELAAATSWEATFEKRKNWWSFQPLVAPALPALDAADWSGHPVDRFILARLEESGLAPAPPADPATLVRRLYFTLIGLPPTADEAEHWQSVIAQPGGYEQLVDHLLARPQFGERWARHWMDWIRYAESHGSEGDPTIDNAWHYRDYLIRALNDDVSYSQLVREHVAGDLLEHPRINASLGINESLIGPAHWRMVFHGFAPTDALEERVRFTDDQINVFSKAFLGLTVSCARCHDHKFDPISQKDYYALFGVLASSRPARTAIDLPEKIGRHQEALLSLKARLRNAVAEDWLVAVQRTAEKLAEFPPPNQNAGQPPSESLVSPWLMTRDEVANGTDFETAWGKRIEAVRRKLNQWMDYRRHDYLRRWNLADAEDYQNWYPHGAGLKPDPQPAGEFSIAAIGDRVLVGIYPAGVYSHAISTKHPARLTSPDIALVGESELWVHAIGDPSASLRYVVQDYPRSGTVYPVNQLSDQWRWQRFDLSYWDGDTIHVELAAAQDAPLLVRDQPRSWFGVRDAVLVAKGQPRPLDSVEHLATLLEAAERKRPATLSDLAALYESTIRAAVQSWKDECVSDQQALLLDACLREGLLPNALQSLPTAKPVLAEYRRLEGEIPVPRRVPGLDETIGRDQPLYERGNHKQPREPVPRRFLSAIDPTPYKTSLSGRRQLAEDLLRDDNPLARRVIVNRIWHHLFGRGIVATPDNFGRLGEQPTHPDLLDWLAIQFVKDGWSLKKTIRLIVTSKTWQLSSHPRATARQIDPDNLWLARANVRRLEAEAIRDSLLAVTGQLDDSLYGPPVDGVSSRRSIYVAVVRNSLDPFLRSFDFPEPFSTVGSRDVTNVPAQSLTLMNDAGVAGHARAWAQRLLNASTSGSDEQRVRTMFLAAFGRPASTSEISRTIAYLNETRSRLLARQRRHDELKAEVAQRRKQIELVMHPVRARLLMEAKSRSRALSESAPPPIGRWEFEATAEDSAGNLHGELRDGAIVEDGALAVSRGGHVLTAPLQTTLREKTLEAWVMLDDLEQRGSGVMTVQTPDGVHFDAIVFGENAPHQWLAGSNNFARTQSFNGATETEAADHAVHVAIAYHEDGRIVGYRNGKAYGQPYQSNGLHVFQAGNTVVGFGVRHLPAGGNRMLAGRVLKAQLYDRALTAEEVAISAQSLQGFVSDPMVMAALTPDDLKLVNQRNAEIAELGSHANALGPAPDAVDDVTVWTDLARALFTFKEFIYVR
ncbi:MAG: DUF1553 domain-containing protein [Pirellulales bacterium]